MVLVIFQIHWQQNQQRDHSPQTSTKTSRKPQPKPLPKCRKWLEEGNICIRALPSKSTDSIPCMEKRGMRTCGFKPMANPRPGTYPGSKAALDSSTPTNTPLWLSAQQPASSLPCKDTLVTSLNIANGSKNILSFQKTAFFVTQKAAGMPRDWCALLPGTLC